MRDDERDRAGFARTLFYFIVLRVGYRYSLIR